MSCLFKIKKIYVIFNKKTILSNISLSLKSGKILTIIGPNGAGKSTLVRIVLKLILPEQGSVYQLENLRIGYVPQIFNINNALPITVHRFMLQIVNKTNKKILSVLKKVKADHLINYSLNSLSSGQIRRVLLARSILNKPQLLVLDEPTQGVDVNGQIVFYNLINQFRDELNCGVLMISHNLHLVMAKTDEVLCLNKHICCSGTPEVVSKHPEFTSMFGFMYKNKLAIYNHDHDHNHDDIEKIFE